MNLKPRIQPALKSLSPEDRELLADWLRKGEYDDVLDRVRKPRSEGGFDLKISKGPLQTFYAKVALLDLINSRGPEDKRMTITQFESIAAGELLLASQNNSAVDIRNSDLVTDDVHSAILQTTYDLATSGENTPTQLLALQRLADFPARAEYRAHKVEMELHRKYISDERLELSKRSQEFRETQAKARSSQKSMTPGSSLHVPRSDDLGPLATDYEGILARSRAKFRLDDISEPASADSSASEPSVTAGSPLSDLDSCGRTSPAEDNKSEAALETQSLSNSPSEISAPCTSVSSALNPPDNDSLITDNSSLEHRVNDYTIARYHEANHGKDPCKVGKWTALKFKTKMQWCPCGQQLPCSEHGDFPPLFWELNPESAEYRECLQAKNLPYTHPFVLIQEQLKREKREQAFKNFPLDPDNLRRTSADHAIRRWRSYTPRPSGTPAPDDSWIQECPCGAKHPCPHHDGLWQEVRYIKPSNPDYAAALKRHDIPVYTPTAEELSDL